MVVQYQERYAYVNIDTRCACVCLCHTLDSLGVYATVRVYVTQIANTHTEIGTDTDNTHSICALCCRCVSVCVCVCARVRECIDVSHYSICATTFQLHRYIRHVYIMLRIFTCSVCDDAIQS